MRLFFPSSALALLSLCLQLVFPSRGAAEILFNVENPTQNQSVSGIGLITGWAFSQTENAQITVRYKIDNLVSGEIPCCASRTDVAKANPQYPQAQRSGFGLLVNFNLLGEGSHALTIEIEDDSGSQKQSQTLTFSSARPGNFQFLSDLDLTPASSDDIEWDSAHQSFRIKGVVAVDKETEKEQEVNLQMAWQSNTQALGVTQSESVGEPSAGAEDTDQDGFFPSSDCNDDNAAIHPGAQEICDDSLDNNCNGLTDSSDSACSGSGTPQPINLALENPSNNVLDLSARTFGGIGVVSGWAVATTPGVHINSVRLRVDGGVVGDLPCCTERRDVQNAFPDIPQALESGFGALVNFNLLSNDSHTFSVEVQDSAGNTQKAEQTASTAKLGDSEFLDKFDLSSATASLDGDILTVEDIQIRDKATQQESEITASYIWRPSCQCFVVQETCGNGTVNTSSEECDVLDLEGETCASFGFRGGTLSCRPRCAASDDNCFLPCTFELKDCLGSPLLYVTNTNSNNVSVIDARTNTVIATHKVGKEPRGIAVSPDGSTVYVANYLGGTLSIIERATNTVTEIAAGDGPNSVAVAPDSAHVYIVNSIKDAQGAVSVFATATKTIVATIPVGNEPQAIALAADGIRAYVTNYQDSSVSVLDLNTRTEIKRIFVGRGPNDIAVAPDGKKVYTVNYGFEDDENQGTVSVIDVATGKVTATITVGFRPSRIAISPDSKTAFVSNTIDQDVSIIDLETLIIRNSIPTPTNSATGPEGIALLPGGQRVYITLFQNGFGSIVQVFSSLTPTIFAEIKVGDGPFSIAVAPAL